MSNCSYTVPNPKDPQGDLVESILYQDISEYYTKRGEPDFQKAEELYNHVKNVEQNAPLKLFIRKLDPSKGLLDQNNELLFKHVLAFITNRDLLRTVRQPQGAINTTITIWETKAKELAVEVASRTNFLKGRKFSSKEKAQTERLTAELLEIRSDTEFIVGLDNYIKTASKAMRDLVEKIEKKDSNKIQFYTGEDLQNMSNIRDNYSKIPVLYKEASEADLDRPGALELKESMLKRLEILSKNYNLLAEKYHDISIEQVSDTFMDNSHLEYVRDSVRKSIAQTEEGKKTEEENNSEHTIRVQNLVDKTIEDNHLYDKEDAKLYLKNLLREGDDISWISRWALQAGNTGSALLRLFSFYIRGSEHRAKHEWESRTIYTHPIYKKYSAHMKALGKNIDNTKELYENLLEVTDTRAYYVGKRKNIWGEHRVQMKKYIQDFINELKRKEAENPDEENYEFWDEELHQAKKKDDRERISKLTRAQRGVYNKSYNEFDEGIRNQYEKLQDLQEKRSGLYKEKASKIKAYRGTADLQGKVAIDIELEEIQSSIYDISDTIQGLEKEIEFFLFKTEYDVLKLPSMRAIADIDPRDRKNLEEGKFLSGRASKKNPKIIWFESASGYNSQQFKNLEGLRDKNSEDPQWAYYEATMETRAMEEAVYPENYRTYFMLPEIGKTGAERWEEDVDNLLSYNQMFDKWLKPKLKETIAVAPGYDYDLNYENTISDEKLQENGYKINFGTKELPRYYKNTGIDVKDQSTNIQFVTLAGFNTGIAYSEKYKILPFVEMFLYLLENRKTSKSSAGAQLVNKVNSNLGAAFSSTEEYLERVSEESGSSDSSKIYQNAVDMVNVRLFGQAINDTLNINVPIPFTEHKLNIRKLFRLFGNSVSLTVLSGNLKSTNANLIYGYFQTLQETFGNEYISPKSWAKGQLDYMSNLKGIISDIGKDHPTSIINLLALKFDPLNNYSPLDNNYIYTNKAYAVFNSNSAHGLNGLSEHVMHVGTMLGVLAETKVLDKEGNYLTANKTTKDREKSMSLRESFSKHSDVSLTTDKRIAFIEIKRGDRLQRVPFKGGEIEKFKISNYDYEKNSVGLNLTTNLIQSINEKMHGPYSWVTAPPMKRTMLGSALLRMKQWFPKGTQVRWAGTSNELWGMFIAFRDKKFKDYIISLREGSTADRYFDPALKRDFIQKGPSKKFNPLADATEAATNATGVTQSAILGYHATQKLRQMMGYEIEDLRFLQEGFLKMTKEQWTTLSANEKANIKKLIMTAATRYLLGGFAAMLLSRDGDDEKYLKLAFYTTRLNTELAAYSDYQELFRIMQSPAVTLSMVQRMYKLYAQLKEDAVTGEFEVYQSGSKKGRTKVGKALRDVLPWGKVTEQHKYIEDILNYHYKEQSGFVK